MDIFRELDLIFWAIANVTTLFISGYALKYSRKKKLDENQRKANLIWSLYFALMLVANVGGVYARLYAVELYGVEIARIIERGTLIFLNIGWMILIHYFDTSMKILKRPYFFYLITIITILSLFISFEHGDILLLIYAILITIAFSICPILFLMIARQSEGLIKTNARRISIAMILFGLGLLFQKQNVEGFIPALVNNPFYVILSPTLIIFSNIIMFLGIFELYGVAVE